MKEKVISISYFEFEAFDELSAGDALLVQKARDVAKNAWAPYSGFKVGAAVKLKNGEVVTGNNQENAAYPSGLCAERVALFAANANFPDSPVHTIALTALNKNGLVREPVKPCGACLQAIVETETRFGKPIRLILDGKDKILLVNGVKHLLPLSFGKDALLT
ncbi:MAG: cytidine deaminase [Prolixibacteraceae bacterium]|nr:cytidine deaminase [Prolixibacteraceae bacterium]